MAGTFIKHIERARAAAQPARPEEKPVGEMNDAEMDAALRQAKVEVIEANRAVAEAAAEYTRAPSLAAKFCELQRGKRKTWR